MRFSELIGQAQPQATFRQMVERDRLPHALLLLSAPGSGGLALAWALAQYLLCNQPQQGDACGQCAHCHKAAKLIHPDLHFSYPTVGSKVTADSLLTPWRTALLDNPYLEINDWLQQIGGGEQTGEHQQR
jgi:DNA polymerase-3 subunit delta'